MGGRVLPRAVAAAVLFVTVAVAGCLAPADARPSESVSEAPPPAWEAVETFLGDVTPTAPIHTFTFEVPEGAAEVEGLLVWDAPVARLGFRLLDPSGEEAARGWPEAPGRAYVTTTHPPTAGTWTVEVTPSRGVAASFEMTVVARSVAPPYGPLERSFEIPPRNFGRELVEPARSSVGTALPRDFAEFNLNMVPGDHFAFRWSADREVYFNVHYHGEEGTVTPMEQRAATLEGGFTAPETQVYSLLWRNDDVVPVKVTAHVDGVYRLHSMTRDV